MCGYVQPPLFYATLFFELHSRLYSFAFVPCATTATAVLPTSTAYIPYAMYCLFTIP